MSQLGCRCGERMSRTDCPSKYILYVYYESEIKNALKDNPSLSLNDFLTAWDSVKNCKKVYQVRKEAVDYWYCPVCKRVYEVQNKPDGRWLRIFKRESPDNSEDYSNWTRLYVMTDIGTDSATESDFTIGLSDYLHQIDDIKYYISNDERTLYAVDSTPKILFAYTVEDIWSS
ncbi:MAG: hypothetical protein K5655_02285 [Lachnospiraceae bacterium]|nr:hypothetical protein [Lachnospiraceae bacterium]